MFIAQQKLIWLLALAAAILVFRKLQQGQGRYQSKAYKLFTYGSCLLIFGTSLGLLGEIGFLGVNYARSWVFFFLESALGYLGGWALIIWGLTKWLPLVFTLSSKIDNGQKHVGLYEMVAKIASHGDSSPATFTRVANAVSDYIGYQAVSLHMMNTGNVLELYSAVGLTEKSKNLISRPRGGLYEKVYNSGEIFQADNEYRLHNDIIVETTSGPVADALCLPVDCGARRVGVITFYTSIPYDFVGDLAVLEFVAANLGQAFYLSGLSRSLDQQKTMRDFMAVIMKTARSEDNLNTQAIRLAKFYRSMLKFDTMHIYLSANGPSHLLDFNLQSGGRVMIERGHFEDAKYAPVKWVINNRRSLSLPEHKAALAGQYRVDVQNSYLYLPILISGQAIGALAVSLAGTYRFNLSEIIACEAVATVLSGVLLNERYQISMTEALDKIGAIKYSLETISETATAENELRELARVVVEKTPSTFCRIMLLDSERNKLQTAAIFQRRDLLWDDRSLSYLPLSELYAHRKVIATGRPLILGDDSKNLKMSEFEMNLLMPKGVSQCLIVPLTINGRTIGLMTVGENRSSSRNKLGSSELIFASLLAMNVSMHLWHKNLQKTLESTMSSNREAARKAQYYEAQSKNLGLVWGLPSRINGPLAGILASCEYLQNAPGINKEEIEKFIGVISRNAEKIHRVSGQFAEVKKVIDKEVVI
jgi:transcriptional regulator with GAF, ATPase, and Fis domain